MISRAFLPTLCFLLPFAALSQEPVTLPPGTPLPVRLPQHLPMKAGEPLRAELMYPVCIRTCFGKGAAVAFPKDTRIVLQTTATQATALKPEAKRP